MRDMNNRVYMKCPCPMRPVHNGKDLNPSSPQSSPPMEERRKPLLPSGEHTQCDRLG